jgi:plasmid stabilization system protein ParE
MATDEPVVSTQALADLDEIWLYIAQDSVEAADRVVERLYAAIHKLAENPGVGHKRQDLTNQAVRFWRVYNYLIVYRAEARPIEIARVLHGYRDIASLLP